jgi:hypothetical protein
MQGVGRACCKTQFYFWAFRKNMNPQNILTTASGMLETFGENAKFMVAEHIDRALEVGDAAAHDEWCLIGKAIALMSMPRGENLAAPAKPKAAPVVHRKFKAA